MDDIHFHLLLKDNCDIKEIIMIMSLKRYYDELVQLSTFVHLDPSLKRERGRPTMMMLPRVHTMIHSKHARRKCSIHRDSKSRYNLLLAIPMMALSTHALHLAVITGSTRTSGPPTILGPRVNAFLLATLKTRGHSITHIDPNDFTLLDKPHFGYAPGKAPENLQRVHSILRDADGYVCVTPEYNHSPSPALLNVLNYFGSSVFSFKPSAIG